MLRDGLRRVPKFVYVIVAAVLVLTVVLCIVFFPKSNYIKRENTITLLYDKARDETIMMYNNEVRWDDKSYVADFLELYDVCLTGNAITAYCSGNKCFYMFDTEGQVAISDDIANFVMCDDGSTIAWVSSTGKVQLYNGVSVRDISEKGSIVNFAISPNGKLLLYMESTEDKDILKVYDTSSRKSRVVAEEMYPLTINKDGSIIYCLDSNERLCCIDLEGNLINSYYVLGEYVVQTNVDHDQIMFYDKEGKAFVAIEGGKAEMIGVNKTQLLLPDSTPVSYYVTTSKSYYVFVNGVYNFETCLLIDGETTLKYMSKIDKITDIATGVTGASLSDDGETLFYILDNALYRAGGTYKSATQIDVGVSSVVVTPDGKKAFYITTDNVLKCYSNGAILSLIENCGNVMVTPENGAMFMCEYDEKVTQGKLYFTQDGVSFFMLSDKAYDCWTTANGAYYSVGRTFNEEGKVSDYDVTIFGSDGDKNFTVLYQDIWDIYNYNYSY